MIWHQQLVGAQSERSVRQIQNLQRAHKTLMAESPAFRKIFLSQHMSDAIDQQKTEDAR